MNFVHHNAGPGLWTDGDNLNTVYDANTCDDNQRMGIFHEISYAAVIRNNIVRRNGLGFPDWIWGAGILVAASADVEIYGNIVEGNADGIGAIQQKRGSGRYGPYQISNLWVHDNTVSMTEGLTGLVQDVGDTSYFTSRNNRFERNRYHLGAGAAYFTWLNNERSETEWRGYNQDVSGTFGR
jgi:parallel beta-helix repeat protein